MKRISISRSGNHLPVDDNDDRSKPIEKQSSTMSQKPSQFAPLVLSFIAGVVITNLASYITAGLSIPRRSYAWNGVISISNHTEICSSSTCNEWDAVVVLGGGPEGPDGLPIWTQHRLDVVLEIYKCCSRFRSQKLRIITTSAGTAHGEVRVSNFPVR
jgi:hypothetical protein